MPENSFSRMDSSGSGNESNGTEGALSSSPGAASLRQRTDSEGSDRQARFILPSTDGSPPKVLTIDEVYDVVKNIQNMSLVHEIALNPEFKLQPYEPPENSLEKRIKDVMHKAFWDVLKEQLNAKPPKYDHAIQLLTDIKECFPQIITTNNKKFLEHINEVLDTTVIRQQAEQGVLDFRAYANFIIQKLAKLCAPVRDEQIKKLSEIEDVVDTFKGILETMTVMKLDMANCLLEVARSDLVVNSVEYEKQKFKEYLEYYKLGFPATENWVKRNQVRNANGEVSSPDQTIYNAYMELLDWDQNYEFPELLQIDKERIFKLSHRALRLCACASVLSICLGIKSIFQITETRNSFAKQLEILLQNVTNNEELKTELDNIWVQIKSIINKSIEKQHLNPLDLGTEEALKSQILQIANKDSPVRNLLWKRLQTYFRLVLNSKAGAPPPPPGYVDFKEELGNFVNALKRVVAYNYSVFGEFYNQILTKQKKPITSDNSTNDNNTKSINETAGAVKDENENSSTSSEGNVNKV